MSQPQACVLGKKRGVDDSASLDEPTRAVKIARPAIPSFPDAYTYQEDYITPFFEDFESLSMKKREEDGWRARVQDESVMLAWYEELDQEQAGLIFPRLRSELQWLATQVEPDAENTSADGVWLTDQAVPSELREQLAQLVSDRLNAMDSTDGLVKHLIDPELYCYVHGMSRTNEDPNHSQLRSEEQWLSFLNSGKPATNEALEDCLQLIEAVKPSVTAVLEQPEPDPEHFEVSEDSEDSEPEKPKRKLTGKGAVMEKKKKKADRKAKKIQERRARAREALQNQPEKERKASLLLTKHDVLRADASNEDKEPNELRRALIKHLASQFRVLPADVEVDMFGKVNFLSYIAGLHPWENKELYGMLSQVIERFLPLWGHVLRDLTVPPRPHAVGRWDRSQFDEDQENTDESTDVFELEEDYRFYQAKLGLISDSDAEHYYSDEEGGSPVNHEMEAKLNEMRARMESNGGFVDVFTEFKPPQLPPPVDLARSTLKIVTKMMSIELNPQQPDYMLPSHAEGIPEEAIIALGIYCIAQENVLDCHLQFKVGQKSPDIRDPPCPVTFCLERFVGQTVIKEGRLVAFPNTVQHTIPDLTLQDKSLPGFCRLLVFWLVDPNKASSVQSTGQVPPTCRDWYQNLSEAGDLEPSLPTEERAHHLLESMQITRQLFLKSQNNNIFERMFSTF